MAIEKIEIAVEKIERVMKLRSCSFHLYHSTRIDAALGVEHELALIPLAGDSLKLELRFIEVRLILSIHAFAYSLGFCIIFPHRLTLE